LLLMCYFFLVTLLFSVFSCVSFVVCHSLFFIYIFHFLFPYYLFIYLFIYLLIDLFASVSSLLTL
jgi:hypothetical protein